MSAAVLADLMSAGMTYRQLDHWTRRGYLRADEPTPGSGHRRTWPPREVEVARTMARLVAAGMSPRQASEVARGESRIGPGVYVVVAPEWSAS